MKGRYQSRAKLKKFFRFRESEFYPLVLTCLAFGFIFSINFPGEDFRVLSWIGYFFLATILAFLTFFFRISLQKIVGIELGYLVRFQVWWEGVIASIILSLLSFGYLPFIFAGGTTSTFMTRQRIGKFFYGFNFEENAQIASWGLWANLTLATAFGILLYVFQESFFFRTGMMMNLFMGVSMLLPLPRFDGIQIFFGSRFLYGVNWIALALTSLLLLSGTKIGLIILIAIGGITGVITTLWRA